MRLEGKRCCAILGHSPMRFAWGFDEEDCKCNEMKLELAQQIMELRMRDNVTQFMVACDCGVGLCAAEAINALREKDEEIMLFCVTPHEEQATKWAPYLRDRYFTMLERCTHMSAVSTQKRRAASSTLSSASLTARTLFWRFMTRIRTGGTTWTGQCSTRFGSRKGLF